MARRPKPPTPALFRDALLQLLQAAGDAPPRDIKSWINLVGRLQDRLAKPKPMTPLSGAQRQADRDAFEARLDRLFADLESDS